jgi:hypothetical protein
LIGLLRVRHLGVRMRLPHQPTWEHKMQVSMGGESGLERLGPWGAFPGSGRDAPQEENLDVVSVAPTRVGMGQTGVCETLGNSWLLRTGGEGLEGLRCVPLPSGPRQQPLAAPTFVNSDNTRLRRDPEAWTMKKAERVGGADLPYYEVIACFNASSGLTRPRVGLEPLPPPHSTPPARWTGAPSGVSGGVRGRQLRA